MSDIEQMPDKRYRCEVVEVHSGDDMVVMADLGLDGLFKRVRIRLQGVDTPDAYKAKSSTQAGSIRDQVRRIVSGRKCVIEVHAEGKGGWICTLHVKDGSEWLDLNERMIEMGYVYQKPSE